MRKYRFTNIPNLLISHLINYFNSNLNLTPEDLEKLSIGITVLIFNIFEMIIVFTCALFLGLTKETLIFFISFVILRSLGAGVHCKTASSCLIVTVIIYIVCSFLSKYYPLCTNTAAFIVIVCLALLFKYAPADTENRPILSKKHRMNLKIQTLICSLIIFIISILINNKIVLSCTVYSLIVETISVLPLTYKLFKTNYNNYKLYE